MPTLRQRITAFVSRRYPFLSGCGTFANSRFVRLAAGMSNELAWGRLDGGAEILVPLNDYVGRAVYFVGDLDRKITEVIRRIVRPGDTVLDIGANLGIITMQLASLVGAHGRVHAFEPNPMVAELLSRTIERNIARNVKLHRYALGAEEGKLDLAFPPGNAGQASLIDGRASDGWKKVSVPVKTLSSVVCENGIERIRLMKIDVEGYESQVFHGARDWFLASPPDAILFEANETDKGKAPDTSISFLTEAGYRLFSIPQQFLNLRLKPYNPTSDAMPAGNDCLAVMKDREKEVLSGFTI